MELVRVPTLTQEVPYAYAAVAPGGTVYAAGACPLDGLPLPIMRFKGALDCPNRGLLR